MEKYNGLTKTAWFISGYFWGNCFSQIFGLDVAWAIGFIAFVVLLIVLITIIVVELGGD
jgi:hypothetical protein